MKNLWLLLLFVLSACSTENKQVHIEAIPCSHRVLVHSESCILGNPFLIALSDSILTVVDQNNEKMLYMFDATSGKSLGGYVKRGQGPDEYYSISQLGNWKDGLFFYDINKRVVAEIGFKDSIQIIPKFNLGKDVHFSFASLDNDVFIASGFYQDGRFCILKDSGTKQEYFMDYPSRDEAEKKVTNQIKFQAYSGKLVVHPSGNQFMFCTGMADMLSFYTYDNDKILLTKEINKTFPDYKYDNENKRFTGFSAHSDEVYLYACGTEKNVYLLYSGKSYAEAGERAFLSSRIDVYNWEGEKVKTLMLDIPIKSMVVSEDDKTVYAISMNPEPQIVTFNL